jgi:hypothetical protein
MLNPRSRSYVESFEHDGEIPQCTDERMSRSAAANRCRNRLDLATLFLPAARVVNLIALAGS